MIDRQGIADVLFSIVLIVALYVWHASAVVAIVSATVAYLGVAAIRTAATSETLRDVAIHRQDQITTRRYHVLQYRTLPALAAAPAPSVDVPQIAYTPPASAVRYVPAVEPRTRAAALEWVWGLLDGHELNPRLVLGPDTKAPGQIQAEKPRAEVLALLTHLKIVRVGAGGMLFWTGHYPTVMEVLDVIQGRGVQSK